MGSSSAIGGAARGGVSEPFGAGSAGQRLDSESGGECAGLLLSTCAGRRGGRGSSGQIRGRAKQAAGQDADGAERG